VPPVVRQSRKNKERIKREIDHTGDQAALAGGRSDLKTEGHFPRENALRLRGGFLRHIGGRDARKRFVKRGCSAPAG